MHSSQIEFKQDAFSEILYWILNQLKDVDWAGSIIGFANPQSLYDSLEPEWNSSQYLV